MPDIPREHVMAVADEISGIIVGSGYYSTSIGIYSAREAAIEILTSTDQAILDALTDALVRAGRLKEEVTTRPTWSACTDASHAHSMPDYDPSREAYLAIHVTSRVIKTRLVTEWREGT